MEQNIVQMKTRVIRILAVGVAMIGVIRTYAQNSLTGKIIDNKTKEPLIGATVVIPGTSTGTSTGLDGSFKLEAATVPDSLSVSFIGYFSAMVKYQPGMRISLDPSATDLNQMVVTASRSSQERKEAPIAITTLSTTMINDAKATSSDQLLNKTPGVYMVDLGNEQHSMAIRQPMSYKSLFLYLEDGLPIRTTGVFNHNALLEMNMSAFRTIEIIRGPASSLYGSEAIGGAVNFITLNPTVLTTARVGLQGNNLGLKRGDLLFSDTYGKVGVLLAGNYAFRTNGYREHSDYEKLSLTGKINYQINDKLSLSNSFTYVDYRADMTGSLDSANFYGQEYSSLHTFTDRDVIALRIKSQLNAYWSPNSKTTIAVFFRDNSIKQNPSYRVRDDWSPWGNPTGDQNLAHGEENDNSFNSYGAIIQHKQSFKWMNSAITGGVSVDYSPSSYYATYISIVKNDDGIYESFQSSDSVLTNYQADMLNTAGYIKGEINPIKDLKLIAAVRFDQFDYDYNNHLDSNAFSGAPDAKNNFSAITPKVGITYDLGKGTGLYANYSQGFVPPQVGEMYRGVKVPTLEPAIFVNYEAGAWIQFMKKKAALDVAVYQMNGLNEIISVRLDNGELVNQNAGKTLHQGIEYGFNYKPTKEVYVRLSGTNAIHEFGDFVERGNDYSGNVMNNAPGWIANAEVIYKPRFLKGFRIGMEWQHMDGYFMDAANTREYDGFDIVHLRTGYERKGFEVWLNIMNLTDELYATNASRSAWGQNYTPGDPRTFTVGMAYKFQKKEKKD